MIVLLTVDSWAPPWARGVMVNALRPPAAKYKCPTWADSGGYQALKHGLLPPVWQILTVYKQIEADVYIAPDVPPMPTDPPEAAEKKMEASYVRYATASKYIDVVPVVHFYRDVRLTWRYYRRYMDYSPPRLAVGAAVPYLFSRAPGRRRLFAFLRELRREYRGHIHVLGAGAPSVIARLAALGVDSTDSATWRLKAAYGKVILPGGGERHVTNRAKKFGGKTATEEELEALYSFLKETGFPALDGFYERIRTSFKYRALVNAWVIQYSLSRDQPHAANTSSSGAGSGGDSSGD
ncbi:tRNA-ribosyltransferase [Pyrobaculum sp.]|uniref:tRNA-ribosyltransferase n=1 Tax=Pyrobaculum sp. TaxID=2004705 RepID=UPI00318181D9